MVNMARRLTQLFVATALILAVGGHWTVLQSVAWVGMAVNYSQDASLAVALKKTFDGEHPCKMCKQISAGKKAEQQAELPLQIKKLEFVSERPAFVFLAPQDFSFTTTALSALDGLTHRPSVPPPRSLA